MELTRRFPIPDKMIDPIPSSHGFDVFTRIHMRLGRLDEVQRVGVPSLFWDGHNQEFWWHFPIERRFGVSWDQAVPAINEALNDFFRKCTPERPSA